LVLIKIKFVSEQTLLTKNNKGEKVSDKGVENFTAEDEWLFQKDLNSSNPNWQIIATS
jgi:predicted lipid-binding transport protein (Tim44 family)